MEVERGLRQTNSALHTAVASLSGLPQQTFRCAQTGLRIEWKRLQSDAPNQLLKVGISPQ